MAVWLLYNFQTESAMQLFNIVNYSQFREQMASHLQRLKRSKRPTLLLQNGDMAAVVLSVKQYGELVDAAEEARWHRRLEEALAQARRAETIPLETVAARLANGEKRPAQP